MKNMVKLGVVLVLMMTAVGCQNQQLLQCQEENLALQEQLAVSEKQLADTKMMYDDMFDLIQAENVRLQERVKELEKIIKN